MIRGKGFMIPLAAIIMALSLPARVSIAQNQNNANPTGKQQNSPSGQTQNSTMRAHRVRASKLMGYKVESQSGESLGTVKDLAIDTRSGRFEFVLISTGGFAGLGAELKAVPPTALSPATAKEKTLALNITPDRWKIAPNFNKEQIANVGNPVQMRLIYRYYGQTWPALALAPGASPPMPPTGRETGNTEKLRLASDLIDKSVANQQGQDMGRITDVIVSFHNPNMTFALLKPGSFITSKSESTKNELFAVPVSAFIASATDKKLLLDINPGEFQQAQPFSADSWRMAMPGAHAPLIFRYQANDNDNASGIAPDNSGQNVRDRQSGTVTPMDQAENKNDLRVTQQIRKSLAGDNNLSVPAKNIKIITANGKVTLRGPVNSDQEKQEISRLAEQAAGSGNVNDELEVK